MTSNGSWQKVRFDEICKNISDRIDDPKQATTDYYVGLEHLDSEDPKISRHGNPQDVGATKLKFKTGHILFGKRRWYLRKLAVAEREGICSAHMMVLESINDKIKKDFLPILMQGDNFFEKALSVSAGSLSPTIKWKDMASLEFVIPSIQQQENILSLTHKIDQTISNSQKLLEKTKNYMVSRRESLLTRGIGHTKFKKVKWLFGEKIEIPETWAITCVNQICKKIVSGGTPDTKNHTYWNGEIPWIRGASLTTKFISTGELSITKEGLENSSSVIIEKNNLIMSSRVSLGNISINKIDIAINQDATGIMLDPSKVLADYFYWYFKFQMNRLISISQGTSIQGILRKDIENFPVSLPDLQEQKQIAFILSNIDEQITQQQLHLSNLKILRKSILNSKLTKEKIIA